MANPSLLLDDAMLNRPSWFTRRLAPWWCVVGWCVATGVFFGFVAIPGGPATGDAWESIYATWAVSHWQLSCMYPPHLPGITTFTAPVYPLFSGGIGAITRIGHGTPFPSGSALGHGCSNAVPALVHWSEASGALWPTLRTGYLSWLVLMAGLIWLLRSTPRGRCGWEPTTLVIVAALPPVWTSVEMYFHPQDLIALGFALAALGSALRNQWVAAGILTALAVLSQQYALLVAIPLLIVAPPRRRLPYALAAVVTAAIIAIPILAVNAGRATRFLFLGSGDASGIGGTVVWELHLHGAPLVLVSRVAPLVLSLVIALFAERRIGRAVLQPAPLMSLIAVSFSLRLVFEQNIFGYYFMALAVSLVVLDAIVGRFRETLVAWLSMVALVYTEPYLFVWRQFWGQDARRWIPVIVMLGALVMILRSVHRHQVGWNVVLWAAAVVCALVVWPVSSDPLHYNSIPVTWLWQVILVGIGVALAARSMWTLLREDRTPPGADTEPLAVPAAAP